MRYQDDQATSKNEPHAEEAEHIFDTQKSFEFLEEMFIRKFKKRSDDLDTVLEAVHADIWRTYYAVCQITGGLIEDLEGNELLKNKAEQILQAIDWIYDDVDSNEESQGERLDEQ